MKQSHDERWDEMRVRVKARVAQIRQERAPIVARRIERTQRKALRKINQLMQMVERLQGEV